MNVRAFRLDTSPRYTAGKSLCTGKSQTTPSDGVASKKEVSEN